jgi:hypothetical protein
MTHLSQLRRYRSSPPAGQFGDAGEDLEQRALAGAVVPDDADDLAAFDPSLPFRAGLEGDARGLSVLDFGFSIACQDAIQDPKSRIQDRVGFADLVLFR